jgi:hypothetical protein
MRSKLFACAAIALVSVSASVSPRFVSQARAANPKGKAADKADKKSPTELHADDKSMKKQMQWEDKVMGPDSTKADLARVARAHALNEKAIKDREAQAAREAVAPPPPVVAKAPPKRAEVALPSVSDGAGTKTDDSNRPHEISPKLSSEEAKAPPPSVKPADDKFIDKLLRDEQETHAKKTSSASDRELEKLLAAGSGEKHARRGDDVDSILKKADSGPAMPAPRAPSALPAWTQQPDISPSRPVTTVVAPIATKPQPKKNDDVIHVVQGAAGGAVAPAPVAATPARPTRGTRSPTARMSSGGSDWNDPFAEPSTVASRDTAPASSGRKAPSSRPAAVTGGWSDPFADKPETTRPQRPPATAPTAPAPSLKRGPRGGEPAAHPPGWKDPFTKAPVAAPAAPVALREPAPGHLESARWEVAARHAPARATGGDSRGGWGVLKKRAR